MPDVTPFSFGAANVTNDGLPRVVTQSDANVEANSSVSFVCKRIASENKWGATPPISWTPIGIATQDTQIVAISAEGDFFISSKQGRQEGRLSPAVKDRGAPLRALERIGGATFCCGMDRQVYKLPFPANPEGWAKFDAGVVTPKGDLSIVGFNAIDGVDENDLYACGFQGEIWRCQQTVWQQLASPTNVVLHALRVVKPDLAFAAGQRGVLLQGKGDDWDQIDHQKTNDDIWGLEWFQDTLYVATAKKLYTLTEDRTLAPVETGLGPKATFRELHTNGQVLWSFGSKTVAYTEDGSTWHDVTP